MTRLVGTTLRCTAGKSSAPCPGVFQTQATGETAREQWQSRGWTEVKLTGGVGYRCGLHSKFDPQGPVYLARADEVDAQITMDALGVSTEAPSLMHDGETQELKRR